ncbi:MULTISPECIES: DUF3099 domain-containing protein [unclassified Rothia (in: high G+C Gram-positive bacteria)]|uniref:DUF3099 domain-containing protein n=1 Tax=unclassified Rothia (in: high G+C Gram-positive bacteria) TaxID=2689056 RepID=UPI00195A72CD|nr:MULTISPECIES: DUF3099 domain-containing protein [unclassified Rothia (in: high G+C Gram-positive bacteria)]MBM7050580.1 DUF3099 domain-containing protein [Rothia sp. ZJ1223]QRZ60772.1 DUF3099 domain-containing protein [Rothia sp. ZJ932]
MATQKIWTEKELADLGFIAQEPQVYSITEANTKHSVDVDRRARQYAFRMFLRIVCIVLACIVDGWLRWGFIALAAILPWGAVMLANGNDRARGGGEFMQHLSPEQQLALAASPSPRADASAQSSAEADRTRGESSQSSGADDAEPVVIDGEIVTATDGD